MDGWLSPTLYGNDNFDEEGSFGLYGLGGNLNEESFGELWDLPSYFGEEEDTSVQQAQDAGAVTTEALITTQTAPQTDEGAAVQAQGADQTSAQVTGGAATVDQENAQATEQLNGGASLQTQGNVQTTAQLTGGASTHIEGNASSPAQVTGGAAPQTQVNAQTSGATTQAYARRTAYINNSSAIQSYWSTQYNGSIAPNAYQQQPTNTVGPSPDGFGSWWAGTGQLDDDLLPGYITTHWGLPAVDAPLDDNWRPNLPPFDETFGGKLAPNVKKPKKLFDLDKDDSYEFQYSSPSPKKPSRRPSPLHDLPPRKPDADPEAPPEQSPASSFDGTDERDQDVPPARELSPFGPLYYALDSPPPRQDADDDSDHESSSTVRPDQEEDSDGSTTPTAPKKRSQKTKSKRPDHEPREGACCQARCGNPDSWNNMVCCENEVVHTDEDHWYHLKCVGLAKEPPEEVKWFCPPCMEEGDEPSDVDSTPDSEEYGKRKDGKKDEKKDTKKDEKRTSKKDNKSSSKSSGGKKSQRNDYSANELASEAIFPSPRNVAADFYGTPNPNNRACADWTEDEQRAAIFQMKRLEPHWKANRDRLWYAISTEMKRKHKLNRSWAAVKNFWNRVGRERSGYDERVRGDRSAMRTSELPGHKSSTSAKSSAKSSRPSMSAKHPVASVPPAASSSAATGAGVKKRPARRRSPSPPVRLEGAGRAARREAGLGEMIAELQDRTPVQIGRVNVEMPQELGEKKDADLAKKLAREDSPRKRKTPEVEEEEEEEEDENPRPRVRARRARAPRGAANTDDAEAAMIAEAVKRSLEEK